MSENEKNEVKAPVVRRGWAIKHIERLLAGETVQFRPRGNSMSGKIESGQLCTVEPITSPIKKGDIVLCQVHGWHYLHIVKAIRSGRYLIGNNRGTTNGWIGEINIFGRLVSVEN